MSGPTQTERVLALLRARGDAGLTPIEALSVIGTFRLASRIWDAKELLRDDEEIVTESVSVDGKTFARYVLRRRVVAGIKQETLW